MAEIDYATATQAIPAPGDRWLLGQVVGELWITLGRDRRGEHLSARQRLLHAAGHLARLRQSAFGVVPHCWALKVFWLFDEGATVSALVHAVIGLGWQAVLLMWLVQHFSRVVRR